MGQSVLGVSRTKSKSSKVADQETLSVKYSSSIPKIFYIVEITELCSNSDVGCGF